MKKRYFLAAGIGLAAIAAFVYSQPPSVSNHYIISGGPILTMDSGMPQVEALEVKGGTIVRLGTLADLRGQAPDADLIDLQGNTLLPGLIEPHTHPIAAALLGAVVDVSGFTHASRQSVMEALKTSAEATAITPWLVAYGWDPVAIADLDPPTLAELDAIAPERPMIVLTQMMHEAYVNSAALRAAGIAAEGAPEKREGILRGDDGRPTGTLREIAGINAVLEHVPPPADPVTELLVRKQFAAYARAGYTTIGVTGEVGRASDPVGLLQHLSTPSSPIRVFLYLMSSQFDRLPLGGNDEFAVLGAKFWMDGSPFTGGAAVEEPYEDTKLTNERLGIPHGHMADLTLEPNTLKTEVLRLHTLGYQIAVHVQGERAIDATLEAFEAAQTAMPRPDLHHRLEHNAFITQEQIARAKRLGVSLGFFIDHIHFYGDRLVELFGQERTERYMPVRWAEDAGVVTTLHGDHPASPIGPFRSLKSAVTRLSRSNHTRTAPNQAITIGQGLEAMTINAARQLGRDDRIGSLAPGKLADFAELSEDPTSIEPERLAEIRVVRTWKSGQPVDTRVVSWLKPHLAFAATWELLKAKLSNR